MRRKPLGMVSLVISWVFDDIFLKERALGLFLLRPWKMVA